MKTLFLLSFLLLLSGHGDSRNVKFEGEPTTEPTEHTSTTDHGHTITGYKVNIPVLVIVFTLMTALLLFCIYWYLIRASPYDVSKIPGATKGSDSKPTQETQEIQGTMAESVNPVVSTAPGKNPVVSTAPGNTPPVVVKSHVVMATPVAVGTSGTVQATPVLVGSETQTQTD